MLKAEVMKNAEKNWPNYKTSLNLFVRATTPYLRAFIREILHCEVILANFEKVPELTNTHMKI